jgi:hypothetical protein
MGDGFGYRPVFCAEAGFRGLRFAKTVQLSCHLQN